MTGLAHGLGDEFLGALDSERANNPLRPAGVQVRLYEWTEGAPRFWLVAYCPELVPPRTSNLHGLLFFMPKSAKHTDLALLDLFSARRYLLSPPENAPFFIRNFDLNDPLRRADWYTTVPNAAFLQQLLGSRRPVFLALPIPSGGAAVPSASTGSTRSVRQLMSLIRDSIVADELARDGEAPPRLPGKFRVLVGGFSRGAVPAADVLQQQPSELDEFYWFDPPKDNVLARQAQIANWVQQARHRRLRLIGTLENSSLQALPQQLSPLGTRVQAMPGKNFRSDNIYKVAVAVPVHSTATRFPEAFHSADSSVDPPVGSLSADTGIFLVEKGLAVQLKTRRSEPHPIDLFTMEELAGKARFGMLNSHRNHPPTRGIVFGERLDGPKGRTIAQFLSVFMQNEVQSASGSIHQWSIVGDVSSGGIRGANGGLIATRAGFRGFLQLCLEDAELIP